ncbi:hypothetical protein HMPREF1545_01825, partial [Oscillibacter sp. KLE 1728]
PRRYCPGCIRQKRPRTVLPGRNTEALPAALFARRAVLYRR